MAWFGPTSYTVHVPPAGEDGARFVADRFSLLAFVFPPLYFLVNRRWLMAFLTFALMLAGGALLMRLDLNGPAIGLAQLLLSFLFALEAASVLRWLLGRAGWQEAGVVVADSLPEAERRFFSDSNRAVFAAPAMAVPRAEPQPAIGLFPEALPKVPRA